MWKTDWLFQRALGTPPQSYHVPWSDSLEKTLMLGKIEGKRQRGWQRMRWLASITNSMDMNLSKLQKIVKDEEPGMLQSMGSERVRHDLVAEQQITITVLVTLLQNICSHEHLLI